MRVHYACRRGGSPSACAGYLPSPLFVTGSGLLSYGVNLPNHAGETAAYIFRILRGESSADLPVRNPTKYELVINLKIAEALGLTLPRP
jgi:putative ABC transport system substrate-binding protein